jgi:glycosyltransferase involved in cell wall biosynthesis
VNDAAAALVAENSAQLEVLVRRAEEAFAAGRRESAAVHVQIAAEFAWLHHSGRFASPRLERLVGLLGDAVPDGGGRAGQAAGTTLHVVTTVYQTGGPTQAISCWVAQDTGHRHTVCVTRQGPGAVPEKLTSRLGDRVGLVRLDNRPGSLLRRAAELRALAVGAEAVLLHTHPYDVVPLLAFARPWGSAAIPGPSVTYVNHADHVFWLGTGAADRVMNMRASGRELTTTRRGIPDGRNVTIARPLLPRPRELERAEARRHYDVDDDQVLVVTAAETSKYRGVDGPGFLDLLEPVVAAHPEVVLLAAGPSPTEQAWRDAAGRTGGRIRALGLLPDVAVLQQAADVYVDSFPFASLTSLLEAGAYGAPVVTYRGHPDGCGVLGSDTEGVDPFMVRASDPEELAERMAGLVRDAAARELLGKATAEAILDTHTGPGWRAALAPLYDAPSGSRAVGDAPERTDPVDLLVAHVMGGSQFSRGVMGVEAAQVGLLPAGERTRLWLSLLRRGARPSLRSLLPEWSLPALGAGARGLKGRQAQWSRPTIRPARRRGAHQRT